MTDSSPSKSTFKSSIISPESRFETGFYTRRLVPYESTYISRFEKRDPSRFRGIRWKNRLKRFQVENGSQKGGTIPGRSRHKPPLPSRTDASAMSLIPGGRMGQFSEKG